MQYNFELYVLVYIGATLMIMTTTTDYGFIFKKLQFFSERKHVDYTCTCTVIKCMHHKAVAT
jgi:hypothetical protein